eukprot:42865_1
MDLEFKDTEINILKGKDVDKMKPIIGEKLNEFKGTNIGDFFWKFIEIIEPKIEPEKTYIEYKINKRPKDDIDDEKKEKIIQQPQKETQSLSMVIDFEHAEVWKTGICREGHTSFMEMTDYDKCDECKQCKQPKKRSDLHKCCGCHNNSPDNYKEIYFCKTCCLENEETFREQKERDLMKSNIIRNQLVLKPELGLDLLCGLPTATSLDKIMNDIQKLDRMNDSGRPGFAVFLIDVDNLKALNTSLTHQGADEVIKNIGYILKKHAQDVNDRKSVSGANLSRCWAFRQGGDEFALVVKSHKSMYTSRLYNFYVAFKNEINNLVHEDFMDKYTGKVNEKGLMKGKKTIKSRKSKQIFSALNDTGIDQKNKTEIMKMFNRSVNAENIVFNIEKIGVSIGLFVPSKYTDEKNWMQRAEAAQDLAKDVNGKNSIRIFYEGVGFIPKDKTKGCLKHGLFNYKNL